MERRLRHGGSGGCQGLDRSRPAITFGPSAANNWFSQALVKPRKPVTKITYPGMHGVGHQWAYLPDVGRDNGPSPGKSEELEAYAVFHMTGHWDADGTEMIEAIRRTAGNASIKVAAMPLGSDALAISRRRRCFGSLRKCAICGALPVRMRRRRALPPCWVPSRIRRWTSPSRSTLIGLGCLAAKKP